MLRFFRKLQRKSGAEFLLRWQKLDAWILSNLSFVRWVL